MAEKKDNLNCCNKSNLSTLKNMGYKKKKHAGTSFLRVHIPQWIAPVETIVAPAKLSASRMQVVLHNFYLCMILAMKRKDDKKSPWSEHGYFPVHRDILKQVATNQYPAYIKVLEDAGIIERRRNTVGGKNYLPGIHSQLYRFVQPNGTVNSTLFRIEKLTDFRCIKSILRTRDRFALGSYNDSKNKAMNDTQLKLREFVLKGKIDTEIAAGIIKASGNDPAKDDYSWIDVDYFEAINEKSITWFKVDSFGERCHSPFTTLESKYRKAIRFQGHEGQPLVNIDIKNSQPFFSAAIGVGDLLDKVLPEFAALKPFVVELCDKPDYKLYLELCTSGGMYEYIGQMMDKSREQVKHQFFRAVLFSKSRVYGEDRVMLEIFKKAFPSVYLFFASIKKLTAQDLPALKDILQEKRAKLKSSNNAYKILSCGMQRLESRLVTQLIAAKMIHEGVGPFLTIHDSYLVLPEHQATVIKIIEDTFRSFQTEPPLLSIELLD